MRFPRRRLPVSFFIQRHRVCNCDHCACSENQTAIHNNLEICDLSFRFSKMMQGVGPQRQCKKRKGYAYAYHQRYQRRV
jgi:hypothetical protein